MPDRQRLLAVIDSLGPGGAEHALLALLPELVARGHEARLVALGPPYDLASAFEDRGVELRWLGMTSRRSLPGATRRLAALIRDYRPTVVHAHLFFAGLTVAATRPLLPVPARVATFHNLGYASYPVTTLRRRTRRALDRLAMRRGMDAWIAVSRAVGDHYAGALGIGPIHVIHNAVDGIGPLPTDLDRRAAARARLGIAPDERLLLCAGTFRHEKGHRYLLAALADLRARGSRPSLAMAGNGPLLDEVKADASERGLEDQVRFLGHLRRAQLLEVMAACDIVVMPSTHEGLPVTALEAMLVGRPVIASRVGGIPELIEDRRSGLLVEPADPQGLAEAIGRLLSDRELRERLSDSGHRAAAQMCDVTRIAEAHEAVYEAAISLRSKSHRRRGYESRA